MWTPILPSQTETMEEDSAAQHFNSAKTCSLRGHAREGDRASLLHNYNFTGHAVSGYTPGTPLSCESNGLSPSKCEELIAMNGLCWQRKPVCRVCDPKVDKIGVSYIACIYRGMLFLQTPRTSRLQINVFACMHDHGHA